MQATTMCMFPQTSKLVFLNCPNPKRPFHLVALRLNPIKVHSGDPQFPSEEQERRRFLRTARSKPLRKVAMSNSVLGR